MGAAVTRPSVAERLTRHTRTRIMVVEELRVLFLPVPKAGCTSMLWTLAGLAGLPRHRFAGSRAAEVSPAMAVHDTSRWEKRHRWAAHSAEQQERILADPGWLRMSVVRDPAARLWSAWQSKILLKEPRFVSRFAEQPWWPEAPADLDEVLLAFRAFVRALDVPPDVAPHDAHWGAQSGLVDGFALTYVGRAEDPAATTRRLREPVGAVTAEDRGVPRENATPIPYHPAVYDEKSAQIVHRLYAEDYAAFGYPPVPAGPHPDAADWRDRAERQVAAVQALADRHLRIGELLTVLENERRPARRA
ncbi:MAG: sulfotransferase family 2 domain-containing protein [Nocardioidaceae bacterium]